MKSPEFFQPSLSLTTVLGIEPSDLKDLMSSGEKFFPYKNKVNGKEMQANLVVFSEGNLLVTYTAQDYINHGQNGAIFKVLPFRRNQAGEYNLSRDSLVLKVPQFRQSLYNIRNIRNSDEKFVEKIEDLNDRLVAMYGKKYKGDHFQFLCGNRQRLLMPFFQSNISYSDLTEEKEIEEFFYKFILHAQTFHQNGYTFRLEAKKIECLVYRTKEGALEVYPIDLDDYRVRKVSSDEEFDLEYFFKGVLSSTFSILMNKIDVNKLLARLREKISPESKEAKNAPTFFDHFDYLKKLIAKSIPDRLANDFSRMIFTALLKKEFQIFQKKPEYYGVPRELLPIVKEFVEKFEMNAQVARQPLGRLEELLRFFICKKEDLPQIPPPSPPSEDVLLDIKFSNKPKESKQEGAGEENITFLTKTQLDALGRLRNLGLSAEFLRGREFSSFHNMALIHLMEKKQLSAEKALQKLEGLNSVQAFGLAFNLSDRALEKLDYKSSPIPPLSRFMVYPRVYGSALKFLIEKKGCDPQKAIEDIVKLDSIQVQGVTQGLTPEETQGFSDPKKMIALGALMKEKKLAPAAALKAVSALNRLELDQIVFQLPPDEIKKLPLFHTELLENVELRLLGLTPKNLLSRNCSNSVEFNKALDFLIWRSQNPQTADQALDALAGLNPIQLELVGYGLSPEESHKLDPVLLQNLLSWPKSNIVRALAYLMIHPKKPLTAMEAMSELIWLEGFQLTRIFFDGFFPEEIRFLNKWHIQALVELKDLGLLPSHLRDKFWFNTPFHTEALAELMIQRKQPPDQAVKKLDQLGQFQLIAITRGHQCEDIRKLTENQSKILVELEVQSRSSSKIDPNFLRTEGDYIREKDIPELLRHFFIYQDFKVAISTYYKHKLFAQRSTPAESIAGISPSFNL